MRNLLILLFGFVLLTAQVTLKDVVSVFGAVPDFSLIFVAALALRFGPVAGAWTGFLFGIAQDAYVAAHFGADALALCTVGYFVGHTEEQVLKLDTIVKILLLAIAFFARLAIRSWFSDMGLGEFAESLLSGGLVQGAVTLALGSIWFVLVSSRDRRV